MIYFLVTIYIILENKGLGINFAKLPRPYQRNFRIKKLWFSDKDYRINMNIKGFSFHCLRFTIILNIVFIFKMLLKYLKNYENFVKSFLQCKFNAS